MSQTGSRPRGAVAPPKGRIREWLVVESTRGRGAFATDEERDRKAYIPRDAAEGLLGRDLGGERCQWFTAEEGRLMRAHPEWRDSLPTSSGEQP